MLSYYPIKFAKLHFFKGILESCENWYHFWCHRPLVWRLVVAIVPELGCCCSYFLAFISLYYFSYLKHYILFTRNICIFLNYVIVLMYNLDFWLLI